MDYLKKIRNIALITASAGLIGLMGLQIGNWYRADHESICSYHSTGDGYEMFMGTEGLVGCIELSRTQFPEFVEDSVCRFGGVFNISETCYIDGGVEGIADGLVDKITFDNQPFPLVREQDFDDFRKQFQEADRILKETKERFGLPEFAEPLPSPWPELTPKHYWPVYQV